MFYSSLFSSPTVYVISDSEMKAYREKKAQADLADLQRLVAHHEAQAEKLKVEVVKIQEEFPALAPAAEAA